MTSELPNIHNTTTLGAPLRSDIDHYMHARTPDVTHPQERRRCWERLTRDRLRRERDGTFFGVSTSLKYIAYHVYVLLKTIQ